MTARTSLVAHSGAGRSVVFFSTGLEGAFAEPPVRHDGWIGSWSPGIGDPSVVGFVTVALYLVAAWLCWGLRKRLDVRGVPRERVLWTGLALALLALGVNKQLDLQSALTEAGRLLAHRQGWYGERRELQRVFIAQVGIFAAIFGIVLILVARRSPLPTRVAVFGACLLFAFVAARAASFHNVDAFIGTRWLGIRANWVLEIGGISLVLAAAWFRRRYRVTARAKRRA